MNPRFSAILVAAATLTCVRAAQADASHESTENELAPQTHLDSSLYVHLLGSAQLGRGLRLNNPFRLSKQLGDDGESLSLTARYLDLSAAILFGDPDGFQGGIATHTSFALAGIAQQVIAPGFIGLYRFSGRFGVLGRLGVPIVVQPNPGAGLEGAVGALFSLASGVGLTTELLYDVFWGAATQERSRTVFPVLAAQMGLFLNFEVLP